MDGAEQQQRAEEKQLLDALQAYVRVLSPPRDRGSELTAGHPIPTWKDIFFFLLFACDLAMIVWSVPEEWLKSTQLEFISSIIPVVGGGLFALIAAWYKDQVLNWSRHRGFRLGIIPAFTALAIFFAVPILPIQVMAHPGDVLVYLDKQEKDNLRDGSSSFRVKLINHSFILKHNDDENPTLTPVFDRNLGELLWLFLTNRPLEIDLVCPYRFTSDTLGVTIEIKKSRPLSREFLRKDSLLSGGLQKIDEQTVRLSPRSPNDGSEPTILPAGEYTAIASKSGCISSAPQPFTILTVHDPNLKLLRFEFLKCTPEKNPR